ncbi:MAG: Spy/CpxP family protein refolding chaperone [Vicinamibacteria bacterium]|nr:Spy/CpxP family protein refolding chaperone [Vicinamibacteria bacterium]
MKNQAFKFAALAAATFGFISLAAAQGPEGGPMRRPGGPGFGPGGPDGPGGPRAGMIARELGLSEDQKAQWKAIHEKEREATEPLLESVREAKEAFDKALASDSADATTVGQAAIAMREAHRKVEASHRATFEAVKAILTPEQLAKLDAMEQRGPRRGPGGPDAQGARRRGPGRSK